MEIAATQSATRAQQGGETGAASTITADFQTFLQLLTTQMQNQDPLNPMESTEFATQLATFSGVEQQVRTNDLLGEMQAAMTTQGLGQFGGWIGMEARVARPVDFSGAAVTVAGRPEVLADRMELVVRNSSGEVVQRVPMPLDEAPMDWTGRAAGWPDAPDGTYSLGIQNWAGEDMISEAPAMVIARIEEAQIIDGAVWLTMADGGRAPAADVVGLRQAQ